MLPVRIVAGQAGESIVQLASCKVGSERNMPALVVAS